MAAVELDPLFVKALKLLHSRNKDSTEQLKQLLDDVTGNRKSDKNYIKDERDHSERSAHRYGMKRDAPENIKKREAEKHKLDKLKQDLAELESGVPAKKTKLDISSSSSNESSKSSSEKEKEKVREKDKERREKEKQREREKEKEREKEQERKRELEREKDEEKDASGTDSDDNQDVEAFVMDLGISCVVCKTFDVSTGNQLVECQECHNLYHQECHKPPVEQDVNDPRFVWYCFKCRKNMKKLVSKAPKAKSAPALPHKEISVPKLNKPDVAAFTAFKRLDPVKSSSGKDSSSGKPFIGLAGLAANLTGKSGESGKGNSKKDSGKTDTTKSSSSSSKSESSSKSSLSGLAKLSSKSSGTSSSSSSNSSSSSAKGSSQSSLSSADKRLQMMKKKASKTQEKKVHIK